MATDGETRVVLLKQGDVLLIGGVGAVSREQADRFVAQFKKLTGVSAVALFPGEISLDLLPADKLRELTRD